VKVGLLDSLSGVILSGETLWRRQHRPIGIKAMQNVRWGNLAWRVYSFMNKSSSSM